MVGDAATLAFMRPFLREARCIWCNSRRGMTDGTVIRSLCKRCGIETEARVRESA